MEMQMILEELSLGDFQPIFTANSITPTVVLNLTSNDFEVLGMNQIGDRVRLRERCRDAISESEQDSPALRRLRQFQQNRSSKGKKRLQSPSKRKAKDTRRVVIGWKHQQGSQKAYKLVSLDKGGGRQEIDVNKNMSFEETTEFLKNTYFPNGRNFVCGLESKDLHFFVATFTGQPIPEQLSNGKPFNFGEYLEELNTSPIRLYLHSRKKNTAHSQVDPVNLADAISVNAFDPAHSVEPLEPDYDSLSDFETTDTPTITFRRRRERLNRIRLRLSNRTSSPQRSSTLPDIPIGDSDLPTPTSSPQNAADIVMDNVASSEECTTQCLNVGASNTDISTSIASASDPQPSSSTSCLTEDIPCSDDDEVKVANTKPELTLEGILTWWTQKTLKADIEKTIVVSRDDPLKSTLRVVTRDFDYTKPFKVVFSGEDGDDLGGPKREFLRLLMIEIAEDVFQGPEKNKCFLHNLDKLSNRSYELAGKLVAFGILHGGCGFPVLNMQVYKLITGMEVPIMTDIEATVFDYEIRNRLQQILLASNQDEYQKILEDCCDWLLEQGLVIATSKQYGLLEKRNELITLLVKNEVFYRVHSEIDQFIQGLNSVNRFFEAIMMAPEAMMSLFVSTNDKFTFSSLRKMYRVNFSPEGSNTRRSENVVIYCLEAFLADCEGGTTGVTLEEMLAFWTGASRIPPLGFTKPLEISFATSAEKRLPSAHTCGLVLELWRGHKDPDDFQNDMVKAITWGGGFHVV